jgi:hypothetical protein
VRRALACTLAIVCLAAACGGGDDEPAAAVSLTVTVRPDGPGTPARTRTVECERLGAGRCAGLPESLAPVPPQMACTSIYGGPAVATLRGTADGDAIDARFKLTDGCEIARWERNARLLGPPPRGG